MSTDPNAIFPGPPPPQNPNPPPHQTGWESLLQRGKKNVILPTIANAMVILEHDPQFADMFGRNQFTNTNVLFKEPPWTVNGFIGNGPYPRDITDDDFTLIHSYVSQKHSPYISRSHVTHAAEAVCGGSLFHPVMDYLKSLTWDGKPRLDLWLVNAFNATNDAYTQAVGAKFLIAAVRRIVLPGSQWDFVPVLTGPQRIGKSTICRVLFDPWFSDQIPMDLGGKDASQALMGMWGVELSDIAQLMSQHNTAEIVKAFLSRRVDRFRPPYGRVPIVSHRQTVIIATSNLEQWARDPTGNTRFLPVKTPMADPEWVRVNKDQMWAEAVHREAAGETTWLEDSAVQKEAFNQQEEIYDEDSWADPIADYLKQVLRDPNSPDKPVQRGADGKYRCPNSGEELTTTTSKILESIGVLTKDQDRSRQMRATKVVRRLGWIQGVSWDKNTNKAKRLWRFE